MTTDENLYELHEEHAVQSKSQPSSHKKKKVGGKINLVKNTVRDSVKKLQYTMDDAHEPINEGYRISKYTNNPYKATSTLSFYNKLTDVRGLGK